ncbi:MAG: mannitol dehydrogenase family protein, partial [Rhodobacteraceae bacterium]|nr:mannitol dehydrogenase family protein [Paracoccaceae bacterium]
VDCIVPATTDEFMTQARDLGLPDVAPVTHETFRQWVIEDVFCDGRPPWEEVGVTLTRDVHSYETMKIRILNGGHQVLANVGEVLSVPMIVDCIQDTQIAAFFQKVQQNEILPQVASVPGMSPMDYLELITRRFANPKIRDTTRRVAFDGSSRHTGFLLPTLREAREKGQSISGLTLAEALWARMCYGQREDNSVIEPNDPNWAVLQSHARHARTNPKSWLNQPGIYGHLSQDTEFTEQFAMWLDLIWAEGCRAALARYLAG